MSTRIMVELVVDGAKDDALHVLECILGGGVFQDAINAHECDAGPVRVVSAVVGEMSDLPDGPGYW